MITLHTSSHCVQTLWEKLPLLPTDVVLNMEAICYVCRYQRHTELVIYILFEELP